MATWTWECLLDGENGTGEDYDAVIAAAYAHNADAEHDHPAISYGNDDPIVDIPPAPEPSAAQLFNDAANAVQAATSLDDIKAAFATIQTQVQPFLPAAVEEPKTSTKSRK